MARIPIVAPRRFRRNGKIVSDVTFLSDPVYMDTSALVKLLVAEPESDALDEHLETSGGQMTTSVITEVELVRAVNRVDESKHREVSILLGRQVLLPITESIRVRAGYLLPKGIRSLDAIHIATAVEIQPNLASVVSYDVKLIDAARSLGLRVHSPD